MTIKVTIRWIQSWGGGGAEEEEEGYGTLLSLFLVLQVESIALSPSASFVELRISHLQMGQWNMFMDGHLYFIRDFCHGRKIESVVPTGRFFYSSLHI
jgi:hypothetical protein